MANKDKEPVAYTYEGETILVHADGRTTDLDGVEVTPPKGFKTADTAPEEPEGLDPSLRRHGVKAGTSGSGIALEDAGDKAGIDARGIANDDLRTQRALGSAGGATLSEEQLKKMDKAELMAEAERRGIAVEGTGEGGNVLKSDLVSALSA